MTWDEPLGGGCHGSYVGLRFFRVEFSDFWLLDVGKSNPEDVFGRADDEYQGHRSEKIRNYNREFTEGAYWDA